MARTTASSDAYRLQVRIVANRSIGGVTVPRMSASGTGPNVRESKLVAKCDATKTLPSESGPQRSSEGSGRPWVSSVATAPSGAPLTVRVLMAVMRTAGRTVPALIS